MYTNEIKESTEQLPILGYTVIASLDTKSEVGHDRLHGALSKADGRADVPNAGVGVAGDFE